MPEVDLAKYSQRIEALEKLRRDALREAEEIEEELGRHSLSSYNHSHNRALTHIPDRQSEERLSQSTQVQSRAILPNASADYRDVMQYDPETMELLEKAEKIKIYQALKAKCDQTHQRNQKQALDTKTLEARQKLKERQRVI